ncbi:4'-phosphopantetheinyl transferase superfamily protein [Arthrobacter sp. PO-11]|uniref:4'-phosphopantetheinyl transferase superfamily protein n=2 Tax=Arthrobacter cavernae TaxID=2817681 RepID=A0A939HFN2_9MICC|nr:4'-phosphopantetheinyl transferase superfamily protein [Arthrobacter cavernae]
MRRMAADLLSPAELSRARVMNAGAAAAFLAGRLAQLDFAGSLLGVPPSSLVASYSCPQCGEGPGIAHGRPGYLLDGGPAPLLLSASRAAGWVLLAAVVHPDPGMRLGVDLEDTAKTGFEGFDGVALTAGEKDFLGNSREPERAFQRTRLWARKEAWLKMTGDGLRTDPSGLDVLDRPGLTDLDLAGLDLAAVDVASPGPSLHIAGRPPSGLVAALALG